VTAKAVTGGGVIAFREGKSELLRNCDAARSYRAAESAVFEVTPKSKTNT